MNSVIIEGKVDTNPEGELSYSGTWRFCKDKKGTLDISYKKVSQEVTKELLDYVSFLDPESLSLLNNPTPTSKSSKKKKKKDSIAPSSTGSSSNKEGGEVETTYIDDNKEEEDLEEPVLEDLPLEDDPSTTYQIDSIHPLMGLWEGDFVVKTATGEDSRIQETLFFHSFLGGDVKNEFGSLPFEPSFPYLLLKSPEGVVRTNFLDLAAEKMKKAKESGGVETSTSTSDSTLNASSTTTSTDPNDDFKKGSTDNLTTPPLEESEKASSSSFHPNLKIQTDNLPSNPVVKIEAGTSFPSTPYPSETSTTSSESNITSILGHPVEILEHLYSNVIYGFGKNPIGRFSIAAFYDPATGELYCEKKYFMVKPAPKKQKVSLSTSTSLASLNPSSNNFINPPPSSLLPTASLFEKLVLGKKATTSVPITPSESIGIMPRPRQIKPVVPFSDEAETEITKKKRLESKASLPGTAVSTPSSNKKNLDATSSIPSSTKEKAKLSSKNKELQQQKAMYQAASNPNSLVGFRNPDNDDLSGSSVHYREAFLDVETGEIYEGEVQNNLRQGTGICIYSDGLMYQGTWNKGRESGRGFLMTGDRKIIYEGDWLDGLFHGNGTYNCGNGDVYVGDFKEGYRHGRGQYTFKNGCSYNGDWKDNKRHGKGTFLWPDGSFYEGDWENDQRHGRGYLELSNGLKIDSAWVRNVCEGKGYCVFPSGQTYQGTYKSGFRDGRGSVQFAEGATYEGRFREDRFDGYGTLKVPAVVPGAKEDEILVPIQIQSDLLRIQWKAGFGASSH